jgi:transcriptional regulator with XRE-family HTH domain
MLRESQHISQERLGELAGLHRTYISAVEAGRRNITIDSMERLAIALGVDIKTLFASIEESDEISSR